MILTYDFNIVVLIGYALSAKTASDSGIASNSFTTISMFLTSLLPHRCYVGAQQLSEFPSNEITTKALLLTSSSNF
ncbi:MAG: hypothetical protein WA667_02865 [Candidatus Nitrosopolaris sp.]